jgi:hypothetical protein
MHKKVREVKRRNVIRREVLDRDFVFLGDPTPPIPPISLITHIPHTPKFKPQPKPRFSNLSFSDLLAPAVFAVAVFGIIFGVQSFGYLSSASDASKEILGTATSAYTELSKATARLTDQNFSSARGLFISAENNLRLAQEKLNTFPLLKFLTPQAQSADRMLTGASYLAEAGAVLSQAMELFDELKVSSNGFETEDIFDRVTENRILIARAKELVDKAAVEFNAVSSVPADYSDTLNQGKAQVAQLSALLGKLLGLEDIYLGFFTKTPKTYLLIFQNHDEARATGGFIGTYGVLGTRDGKIDRLKIESIYNIDGQLYDGIAAPGPFQPEIQKWGVRDANWFADFPTSAEKLAFLYEKVGGTVDGVIAATPQLFADLLVLTGPIEMSQYGVTLTAENFQDQVQFKTSVDYDLELNQPKKFLADFAPIFLNRLTNIDSKQWLDVFQIVQDNLDDKQVLLYHKTKLVQDRIVELGAAGEVKSTEFDYLSVINSNLGGTKTDLSIYQTSELVSKFLNDGSVSNSLVITRDNRSQESNRSFIRIMVPMGSTLVSATGFDPYEFYPSESLGFRTDPDLKKWDEGIMNGDVYIRSESGKTVFSGWIETPALDMRQIKINYSLPVRVSANQPYSLLVQKQSGSTNQSFTGQWDLGAWNQAWISRGVEVAGKMLKFSTRTNSDEFWGTVITK